ncbi:AAA family ATPase [Chryseobacterium sp. A321]
MITREITTQLLEDWDNKKALILLGPRQVGKTTLIQELVRDQNVLKLNSDVPQVRLQLADANFNFHFSSVEPFDVIFLDEAQRIENIGIVAKLLIDANLGKQLIITGSSSLDLGKKINEPLTGRKWEHQLFPLSWREIVQQYTFANAITRLLDC